MLDLRTKIRSFFSKFGILFYLLKMKASWVIGKRDKKDKNFPVASYKEAKEIPAALGWGMEYRSEKRDNVYHPTVVQRLISQGKKVGDCIPKGTLLLKEDGTFVAVEKIQVGDKVYDGHKFVSVGRTFAPSYKTILIFTLSNGCTLEVSRDHKLFDSALQIFPASQAVVGKELWQPQELPFGIEKKPGAVITGINSLKTVFECYDLLTESGKIYLPESDVIIHNCDDHAIYTCTALLKNKLVKKIWYTVIYFEGTDGKRNGHALCVFKGLDDKIYWSDYNVGSPVEIDIKLLPNAFDWIYPVLKVYSDKIIVAYLFEIKSISEDDTPVFGKIQAFAPHEKFSIEEMEAGLK